MLLKIKKGENMKRENVYKLIDGEREYQNSKPARPKTDEETSVAEWLTYIEHQLNEAKSNVYVLNEQLALENIRKIAGLTVACMEHNETRAR
jgi:hypothetical protein